MGSYGLTDDVRALRERMRKFIDEQVIPAEARGGFPSGLAITSLPGP